MLKINLKIDNNFEKSYYDEEEMFFDLLELKRVSFPKLVEVYTKYLELENEKHRMQLSEIDAPLIEVFNKSRHLSVEMTKDCIVRYLVKYDRFKNAPIQEDLVKHIKDNNINLDGMYYRDLYLTKKVGEWFEIGNRNVCKMEKIRFENEMKEMEKRRWE